jgi:hypothetical protein
MARKQVTPPMAPAPAVKTATNNDGIGITRTSAGTATSAGNVIADHTRRIPANGNMNAATSGAARTKVIKQPRTTDQIAKIHGPNQVRPSGRNGK